MKVKHLVGVRWADARGESTKVLDEGSLTSFHNPVHITTYGLLLVDDDIGITVATEDCEDGDWRGPTFIPRSLVKEVWVVSKNPQRRRKTHVHPPNEPSESSG